MAEQFALCASWYPVPTTRNKELGVSCQINKMSSCLFALGMLILFVCEFQIQTVQ